MTIFVPDAHQPGEDANAQLAYLLSGPWAKLKIVKIERITSADPQQNGWQAYM